MGTDRQEREMTCQFFIDSVNYYFERMTKSSSECSVPFLKKKERMVLEDYTGMIGVSGNRKGFVYFTGSAELFKELIKDILKINNPDNNDLMDIAGELANTVAGNVREVFGHQFMISVPAIFEGKPANFKLKDDVPIYVVPIIWKNHKAYVVLAIE